MRPLFLSCLLLVVACSDRAPVPVAAPARPSPVGSLNSGLGTVVSVEPVRITEGFGIWREGVEVIDHDGLLIRVDGFDGLSFLPRAMTGPLFVLGGNVGLMLISPLHNNGQVVLLMDSPPSGTEVALWMTNAGESPTRLKGQRLEAAQARALSVNGHAGINIRTPPANAPRATYPTLRALMENLYPLRFSPDGGALD